MNKILASVKGPIVMVGYGSIGKGFLPLLQRHVDFDKRKFVIIDPDAEVAEVVDSMGYIHETTGLTPENYKSILSKHFEPDSGFCVNLSVNTSSVDVMRFCRENGVPYIDAVTEPWEGEYADIDIPRADRTNYFMRETVMAEKARSPGGPTAVSCCGANPGMVNWFVKDALMRLGHDIFGSVETPRTQEEWGRLMQRLGVKGIHVAERDTQVSKRPKPVDCFVNTWSVEGFISEGLQPAELGYGTHEKEMPPDGYTFDKGCKSSIWLDRPGATTRVLTWCPSVGQQYGFLVTHNEAVSISDYYTLGEKDRPDYRPTCHYAYHPCNDAVLSLHELVGTGKAQKDMHIMTEDEIISGIDELGVLLYGHKKNALWFGSRLSIEETRELMPEQNATGLQVTSGILAGMIWAIENPNSGIVEADNMDYARCLEIQRPYLGPLEAHYTDWHPLKNLHDDRLGHREDYIRKELDKEDPWQFKNIVETW
jgi:homospermidine synthase